MAQASTEKLEHTGSAEKETVASVPQRERERAVGKYARAVFAKKKKKKITKPSVESTTS